MTDARLVRMGAGMLIFTEAALAHTARDPLDRHLVDLPDHPSTRAAPAPLDPSRK
jgi:hypothetical protein